jgi:hypothetical protein
MPTRRFEPARIVLTPYSTYWREIVVVLCLKAAALTVLYFLFFAPADRPAVMEQVVAHHLLTTPRSGTGDEVKHDR